MDIIMYAIMLIPIVLFLILSYLIVVKKQYFLISGYATRSQQEQEELVCNGYPQAMGRVLFVSTLSFIVGIPLQFFEIPYAMELTFGCFFIILVSGMLWATKFEVKSKRKRSFFTQVSIFLGVIIFIGAIIFIGYQKNEVVITDQQMQVTKTYGVTWDLEDITSVELVQTLPEIEMRTNGFGTSDRAQGHFKMKDKGKGLLFLYRNHPPYLVVNKKNTFLIINSKDAGETVKWYEELQSALKGQ